MLCSLLRRYNRYSTNFEGHLENVPTILGPLRSKGIKLNPKKCSLFKDQVSFLGQIISKNGYAIYQSVDQVRKLLCLLGYYWRYIENFAIIASPLSELLKGNSNLQNK